MSELIKYERIQTTENDVHAQNNDDEELNETIVVSSSSMLANSTSFNNNNHHQSSTHVSFAKIDTNESKRLKLNIAHATFTILILILIYFCLSIGLTFYQRWLLKQFNYPLFVVTCHLFTKLFISLSIRILYRLVTGKSRIKLDFRTSFQKVLPTGLASGIDIGFSNWGLGLVSISLYTMTKSTTIIFILIFAIILGLEKRSWSLMAIVIMISCGLCLFTYKSSDFNTIGFVCLLFASFVSGIRWSLAQLIMQKSKLGLHNPIDMVYQMQPWMILSIVPFTIGFEGKRLLEGFSTISDIPEAEVMSMVAKIIIGAIVAFCMELSEFLVLSFTSSLTLSISGIFKEICQLVLAVKFNGDQLSPINVLGLFMCLGGICSHVIHKYATLSSNSSSSSSSSSSLLSGGGGSNNSNSFDGGIDNNTSDTIVTYDNHLKNNEKQHVRLGYHRSGQNVPLLQDTLTGSDSDDSQNDNQNANDIIFDVLKRRDTRR